MTPIVCLFALFAAPAGDAAARPHVLTARPTSAAPQSAAPPALEAITSSTAQAVAAPTGAFLARGVLSVWKILPPIPTTPATPKPPAGTTEPGTTPPAKSTPAGLTADQVVGKVQGFYAGIKQVTAKFEQDVTNSAFGTSKNTKGTVWIAKPGKMRWDYYGQPKAGKVAVRKSFISNGSYLYVVEHENKQVIKKDLQKDLMPVAVSFLYGKGDLRATFNSALDVSGKYGAKGDIVLLLTPKKPDAQYKNLYLVVDPSNFRVKRSVIIDSSGNTNSVRFYEPNFATAIAESSFLFSEVAAEKAGYKVVSADQAAEGDL